MKNFKLDPIENEPVIIKSSRWLRAPQSGVFHAEVKNGQYVEQGDLLGFVSDPYGLTERKIKSNTKGFIICTNEAPLVNKGDAIFHIGTALVADKQV
ncbi:Succinylglutamate desuccinylase / Aspartoacylase family protein [compost metagenome]